MWQKKATSYTKSDEEIVFRLYNTNIVTVRPTEIILNTGGWRTKTTKLRMNKIADEHSLGYQVYSEKGRWVVAVGHITNIVPFHDGMSISRL